MTTQADPEPETGLPGFGRLFRAVKRAEAPADLDPFRASAVPPAPTPAAGDTAADDADPAGGDAGGRPKRFSAARTVTLLAALVAGFAAAGAFARVAFGLFSG